jgi:hypothetical protein
MEKKPDTSSSENSQEAFFSCPLDGAKSVSLDRTGFMQNTLTHSSESGADVALVVVPLYSMNGPRVSSSVVTHPPLQ